LFPGGSPSYKKGYSDGLVAGAPSLDQHEMRVAPDEAVSTLSIEQTIDGVILPAIKEIGTEWSTASVTWPRAPRQRADKAVAGCCA
jgi:hypothetical protein